MHFFLSTLLPLVACLGYLGYTQPICQDLKAPFQYGEASYCPEYNGFGCCGKREERRARKWALYAQLKLRTEQEREICSDYSRNVSCLGCSPFAGRIFDSANDRIPLCRGYCIETYVKCRLSLLRMFKLHPWRKGLVSRFPQSKEELERDAEAFCERYASDSPHCYPQVAAMEREYTAPPEQTDCVCAIPIASGLRQPLAVVGAGDNSDRLFIMEQPGVVRILDKKRRILIKEPFLNMTSQLMAHGEIDGVINIAFHPDYRRNGRVYVYYHYLLSGNINGSGVDLFTVNISEFQVDENNPNQVDYESQRLVFSLPFLKRYPEPELTGGGFFFNDGYLFLGIGVDEETELQPRGQDLGSYRGKILRFDVDNRDPGKEYAIPPDNPFINDPSALPEIYAYGYHMPWRCSVDSGDPITGAGAGQVFCPDVGTNITEEVNLLQKGSNYGYPVFEGDVCRVENQTCDAVRPDMTLPIDSYAYGTEGISVIGGHVYRGCLYPNLNGMYIYGDFIGGLLALKENRTTGQWERRKLCIGDSQVCPGADTLPRFVQAFGEDDGGEVYLLGTSIPSIDPNLPAAGVVYQIADPARRTNTQTCKRSRKFTPDPTPVKTDYLEHTQPICQDLKAPFQYSEASYCPEYNGFGCCSKREERQVRQWALHAQLSLETQQERDICRDYSRNISCLSCSPLAGRIFNSVNDSNNHIPLCHSYCIETYVKCRRSLLRMFKLHPWEEGLVSKFPQSKEELERDAEAFCERYASDTPHCYPQVATMEREYTAPPEQTDCVCVIPIASGLRQPVAVVGAGDKSDRLFILEQPGVVRILDKKRRILIEEPFLNVSSVLMVKVEFEGLMNIAFHPDFRQNGRVYVYYHSLLSENVNGSGMGQVAVNISEFHVDENNPNQVDYESERLVFSKLFLTRNPQFQLHGGAFFFKDGYLFLGLGDADEIEGMEFLLRGQDLGSYRGKILRFDVDNRDPGKEYAIPPDNPFINDPSALPEIYAYGYRMPWRCSVDSGDPITGAGAGQVFCPDVSTNIIEEVNLLEKGGNYGFPVFEGDVCRVDNQTCQAVRPDMTLPIDSYAYGTEGIAVLGGHVYRGCLYPNLNGMYIYGDFIGGLLALKENRTGQWERRKLCIGDSQVCPGANTLPRFLRAFGQDDGGEIYLIGNFIGFRFSSMINLPPTGVIYQIADPARRNNPQTCKRSRKFIPMESD